MNTHLQLTVASATIREGEMVPMSAVFNNMGCTGDNISPDLSWRGAPEGTKSFAVTLWDPDAPTTVGFTHWILFDLDPSTTMLEAGAGKKHQNPHGSTHGMNDMGQNEYSGPCPPPGDPTHRYVFTVYALDVPKLEANGHSTTYPLFRFVAREHILATATVTGTFGLPAA